MRHVDLVAVQRRRFIAGKEQAGIRDIARHRKPEPVADHAVADNFFPLFKAPGNIGALGLPRAPGAAEDPRFAFYSRWVALMYRHLIG